MPNSRIEVYNGKYVDDQMANGVPEGGTTGQVLKKASNNDYDLEWGTGGGGGSVASVTGTAPIASSGGTNPDISISQATTSTNGYLSSTDWNTFNSKGNGTVTSVAALTLGTTGTDISSTVANSTTTPVITLNVPTASATNRGALSSTDWTAFNSKMDAFTLESDWVAPYNYLGEAPVGSSTSASVWTIKRIQVSSSGATTTLSSAPNVKWTDRYTVVYS